MIKLGMVGAGFVADLYMRSFATFPDIFPIAVYDVHRERQDQFCAHWRLTGVDSLEAVFAAVGRGGIVLNLTNPASHFEISRKSLEAGLHVYSEKPMALRLEDAKALHALAAESGLLIASAPCSFLSESAQTVAAAIRLGVLGKTRVVYAELDDDFIAKAPYQKWRSVSGAPWPAEDEFNVGCTLEHAGYYLTWLIAMFGSVRSVVAASACVAPDQMKTEAPAPDFSVATLFFECGVVARLTCSILAPRNRSLLIAGDNGLLELDDCWDNAAAVRFRRRFSLRRRLFNAPIARRLRLTKPTHPMLSRLGPAAMNFALGPKEMLDALTEARQPRVSADLALHLTEVTLAIQSSGEAAGAQRMQTRCDVIEPMPWARTLRGI